MGSTRQHAQRQSACADTASMVPSTLEPGRRLSGPGRTVSGAYWGRRQPLCFRRTHFRRVRNRSVIRSLQVPGSLGCETRRHDCGTEALTMSDLNWNSAVNTMPLQKTPGSARSTTYAPRRNSVLRRVKRLLQLWRERKRSHPQLCELDDYILRDIGLTRDTLLCESTRPYWR